MAAPQFVPNRTRRADKAYVSPPRRAGSWRADRPGDLVDGAHPRGVALGNQGPDQGFALKLVRAELPNVTLADGEHAADVVVGAAAVATRRASLDGRAPMIDDVRLAFEVFGFYDERPEHDLAGWRRPAFAGLSHTAAHYMAARALAAAVPEDILRGSPAEAATARRANWRAAVGI
ncbi:MAG: hypothetical protein ACR2QE_08270 [Acidimicrobiales bacterium]